MGNSIYRVLWIPFVFALFSGCAPKRIVDVSGEAIVLLSNKEEHQIIPPSFSDSYIPQVRRNLMGDKLFVSVDSKVVSVDSSATKTISAPGVCSYFNEREEYVTWFNNLREGVFFKDGYIRPLTTYERFGIDPGGSYFYISTYSNYLSTIYSTGRPESPLIVIPSFIAYAVFFYDHTIFVFGHLRPEAGTIGYKDVCYEIIKSNDAYHVQQTFEIPGAVVDMSPTSKRLLLDNRSDLIPLWFLYDMKTQKKRFISKRDLHGFFITYDLADRLKEREGEGGVR